MSEERILDSKRRRKQTKGSTLLGKHSESPSFEATQKARGKSEIEGASNTVKRTLKAKDEQRAQRTVQ